MHRIDGIGIYLRPPRLEDAPAHCDAVNESVAALTRWMPWPHLGYLVEESRVWISYCLEEWDPPPKMASFFIFDVTSDEFVGQIDLLDLLGRPSLGYWVRSSRTGRGIATEAARSISRWGFGELDIDEIEIIIDPANEASLAVAEKLGARDLGILPRTIRGAELTLKVYRLARPPRD